MNRNSFTVNPAPINAVLVDTSLGETLLWLPSDCGTRRFHVGSSRKAKQWEKVLPRLSSGPENGEDKGLSSMSRGELRGSRCSRVSSGHNRNEKTPQIAKALDFDVDFRQVPAHNKIISSLVIDDRNIHSSSPIPYHEVN